MRMKPKGNGALLLCMLVKVDRFLRVSIFLFPLQLSNTFTYFSIQSITFKVLLHSRLSFGDKVLIFS